MLKRITIYILLSIILCMTINTRMNELTIKDNYVDYFVRGYVRACQDKIRIEDYPEEERNMKLYMKFAADAIEYIKKEIYQ